MIVTVKGDARKKCPYRDEMDEGTAVITFDVPDGEDATELHALSAVLKIDTPLSHEDFTRSLACHPSVIRVVTTWQTAGLEVTVEVPDRRE